MNVDDADDAFLLAKAEIDEEIDDIFAEFFQPDAELALVTMMNSIPPDVQARLKELAPEAYENVTTVIEQIKRGNNG